MNCNFTVSANDILSLSQVKDKSYDDDNAVWVMYMSKSDKTLCRGILDIVGESVVCIISAEIWGLLTADTYGKNWIVFKDKPKIQE